MLVRGDRGCRTSRRGSGKSPAQSQVGSVLLGLLVAIFCSLLGLRANALPACVGHDLVLHSQAEPSSATDRSAAFCRMPADEVAAQGHDDIPHRNVPICSERATSEVAPLPVVALSGASLRQVKATPCPGQSPRLNLGEQDPTPQANSSKHPRQPMLAGRPAIVAIHEPGGQSLPGFHPPRSQPAPGIQRLIYRPPR
jgi:hypothetical protein